jgi:cytochrome c-type biogenesis protein CcmF
VLTSVHAFATDPKRGVFILFFLAAVVGSSLTLFAWRAPKVSLGGAFALVSRETLLLLNNVLLVVACGSVLLGTLYPLILDALNLGKISVGPPYFNAVFVPIMVPLLFLMAAGPIARWKHADVKDIAKRLALAFAVAVVGGALLPLALGPWSPLVAMGLTLALWITASAVVQIRERMRTGLPPSSYWGMQLAHLGIAVFVVGVTLVGGYQVEKDVRMEPGETVTIDRYTFRFLGVKEVPGPNYKAMRGDVELIVDGKLDKMLHPEKRNYFTSQMPMTEAAIDTGFTRDVYVSLGEPLDGAAWAVRVYYKPFVDWIWGGCLLMALGGLLAASDRRYRIRAKAEKLATAGAAA